jgi:hypothetical protein
MKRLLLAIILGFSTAIIAAADPTPVYSQDFSKSDVGSLPDEFLVLDGQFAVREDGGNRFLELPGAPLESYGFLFGPSQQSGFLVAARIQTTKQGRKFSTFGVGLSGASGYRLQVTPAKKAVELFKADSVIATAPFDWKSGEWTELRLSVRKIKDGEYKVEGKAWIGGTEEPKESLVTISQTELPPAGKSGAWGMPFAGNPIRFDDLRVTPLP